VVFSPSISTLSGRRVITTVDALAWGGVYRVPMGLADRIRHNLADLGIVALFAAAELDVLVSSRSGSTPAMLAFAAAWTLPLLFRRRWPAAAALIVLGALALEAQIAYPATESQVVLASVVIAFFTIGRGEERSRALLAGALGLTLGITLLAADSGPLTATAIGFLAIVGATPLATGMLFRTRQQESNELAIHAKRLAREQEELARQAVIEERARIARELHDMIGHAISVITVQAGAARLQLDLDPERARQPLLAIEQIGHDTLAEMRRLLGMLRDMGEPGLAPQPGLAQLDRLMDGCRQSGLPVELRTLGDQAAALPPSIDLTAYRVLQEALTNALKHGSGGHATITVRYALRSLGLEVESQGLATRNGGGGGQGLIGMRERVEGCGGELQAGETPGGGYAVRATLPLSP
jgi:signal transduction histidine kinase